MRQKTRLLTNGGSVSLFAAVFMFAIGFAALPARAGVGLDAINDASIAVKTPARTNLVAVTRLGQRLFAVGQHGVIIYSDDSGVSWKQAHVPVDLLLTAIYFSSPSDGWAVGHYGVILHSSDGGLNWAKEVDGLDVIAAVKNAAAQFQASGPASPQAALALRVANAYSTVGPSKPFLAVGGCAGSVLAGGQQDMAMLTADNGKTWQQWTSNIANPHFNNIYAIADEGSTTFLIGEQGMILKSDAACQNFQPVAGPYTATLFGGNLISPGTLLVYGLDGGLYLTRDDGKSWQTLAMPDDVLIDSSVRLPSNEILLGTLGGRLYLSDPGLTAFHVLKASEPFQISDMALAPNGNVVIVGNGGVAILGAQSIQ